MKKTLKTTKERSEIMKKIHGKDTKIELKLRKALWHLGLRYRKNYKFLPGSPDIALTKYHIAIFVIAISGTDTIGKHKNLQSKVIVNFGYKK